MNKKELALCGVAVILLLVFAWMVRWQLVPISADTTRIYLLDRWTGRLYIVQVDEKSLVTDQK